MRRVLARYAARFAPWLTRAMVHDAVFEAASALRPVCPVIIHSPSAASGPPIAISPARL